MISQIKYQATSTIKEGIQCRVCLINQPYPVIIIIYIHHMWMKFIRELSVIMIRVSAFIALLDQSFYAHTAVTGLLYDA